MKTLGYSALLLLYTIVLQAQPASFTGIAINSQTGQPLSGVHLKLFTWEITGGIADAYGAMSDRDGRFSMSGIPPGTYVLYAERRGFVHMITPTGAVNLPGVALKPGQQLASYRLEMTPRAIVAGRVLDEYGDPAPNVRVEAQSVSPSGPRAVILNGGSTFTTSRGEFRIIGGPGKFLVKATPAETSLAREIRTDGSSDAAYGPTWYPAVASADRASVVEAVAGGDISIEIRLLRQRTLTITGTVLGASPDFECTIHVVAGNSTRNISAGPDGKFTLAKLAPASYRVWASAPGNRRSQSVEVNPDRETAEVELVLNGAVDVTGAVKLAGEPPDKPIGRRTVSLTSASGVAASAMTDPDGSFKLPGISRDVYAVGLQPLPENGYVKTVELDGVETRGKETDFTRAVQGSRLNLTVARDGGEIYGILQDKSGQPLGNTLAIVILAPDRDHIEINQEGMVKEGGKFSLHGIRPGKYLLFAIDAFRSGPVTGVDDLRKLAAAAEEIEIKPFDRIKKDLRVIVKEDVDARTQK